MLGHIRSGAVAMSSVASYPSSTQKSNRTGVSGPNTLTIWLTAALAGLSVSLAHALCHAALWPRRDHPLAYGG